MRISEKQCKCKHDYKVIVIDIVFVLLDKGHEADNLQKECSYFIVTKSFKRGKKLKENQVR